MTITEYKAYKVYLERNFADKVYSIATRITIGKNYATEMEQLFITNALIEIILEYNLFEEDEDNFNSLTVKEMKDINFKLNNTFKSLYNPDFVLTL
jgi:hypothetical protein